MFFRLSVVAVFTILALCPQANISLAQSGDEKAEIHGSVDWLRFMIRAYGTSASPKVPSDRLQRIDALEAAKKEAANNLLEVIKPIPLGAEKTIGDEMQRDSLLRHKILSYVQRYTITDTRSMSDMSVEVDVELPVMGGFIDLFVPKSAGEGQLILDSIPRSPLSFLPWPECRPVPEGVKLVIPAEGLVSFHGQPFTGLVIDARGMNVSQSLLPRVLDEEGREIYGLNFVKSENATASGLVGYRRTLKNAMRDARVGKEPLLICAARKSGRTGSDVVVSANDAIIIHAATKISDFLKQGKVVFVVGEK